MAEKIKPIEKVIFKEYLGDFYENVWVPSNIKDEVKLNDSLKCSQSDYSDIFENADSFIFMISDYILTNEMVDLILNAVNRDVRVYLLLNSPNNSDLEGDLLKSYKNYLSDLAGKTLIRFTNNINFFMLISGNNTGFVSNFGYYNTKTDKITKHFKINLLNDQITEAVLIFKKIFWFNTQFQILEKGHVDFPVRIKKEDVPFNDRVVETKYIKFNFKQPDDNHSLIQDSIRKICREVTDLKVLTFSLNFPEDVITSLKDSIKNLDEDNFSLMVNQTGFHPKILNIEKNFNVKSINLIDNDFNFINTNNNFILFPKSIDENLQNLAIILNKNQADLFLSYFQDLEQHYRSIFYKKIQLSNLKGNIFQLTDDMELEQINIGDSEEILLDDIKCKTIDEFLKKKDEDVDVNIHKKKFLKNAKYKWNVIPPYLEKKAIKDELYEIWNSFYDSWNDSIKDLEKIHNDTKIKFEAVNDQILLPWRTGKLQKLMEIREEIDNLKIIEIKKSKYTELNNICKNLTNLNDLMVNFNRFYKKAVEISTEIENNTLKINESKKTILSHQEEIEKLNDDNKAISEKIDELKNKLKKSKPKGKKKQEFKEYQSILKKHEENLKKNSDTISKLNDKNNTLNKEIESLTDKNKDLTRNINTSEFENESEDSISKEKNKYKFFGGRKKEKSQEQHKIEIKIPEEELPKIGTLFSTKKQRYLVISYYSEINPANEESKKYNAKLVVSND